MADINDIQTTADGQPWLLTASGWKEITLQEAEQRTASGVERFGRGVLTGQSFGVAGALGNVAPFAADVAGVGVGVRAGVRGGASAVQSFLGGGGARARQVQGAVPGSAIAPDPATAARSAEVRGAMAMDLSNPTMAIEREAAVRSVGAAERRSFLEDIRDEFNSPAELTPAQMAAIPEAERLGFQFLPGQIQGSRLLLEGVMSNPILRTAVEAELSSNRRLLQTNAARTIEGLDDAIFDADTIGDMADTVGARFDDIRNQVGSVELPGVLADDVAPLLSAKQRRGFQIRPEANTTERLSGQDIMDIRSRLNQQMADAFKRPGGFTEGTDIADIIQEIDDIIEATIGPEGIEAWRKARTEWRFFRLFDRPGTIDLDTGNINVRTMRNALRRDFKKEFGRKSFGKRANLTQAQSDFLDTVRVAGAFKENLGDSGTAGRLISSKLLTSPVDAGKAFLMRAFLQREAGRLNQ